MSETTTFDKIMNWFKNNPAIAGLLVFATFIITLEAFIDTSTGLVKKVEYFLEYLQPDSGQNETVVSADQDSIGPLPPSHESTRGLHTQTEQTQNSSEGITLDVQGSAPQGNSFSSILDASRADSSTSDASRVDPPLVMNEDSTGRRTEPDRLGAQPDSQEDPASTRYFEVTLVLDSDLHGATIQLDGSDVYTDKILNTVTMKVPDKLEMQLLTVRNDRFDCSRELKITQDTSITVNPGEPSHCMFIENL